MQVKDRIKELRRVPAKDLIPNEVNWRTHPTAQKDALRGVLADIGIADAVVAYETPDGLKLIDGHLRAETLDQPIPVLILDVDEEEAKKLLLSFDPLGAMATADEDQLASLLQEVHTDNQALQGLFDNLAELHGLTDNWSEPISPDDIEEYDPTTETFLIKIVDISAADKEDVLNVVNEAIKNAGYDYTGQAY